MLKFPSKVAAVQQQWRRASLPAPSTSSAGSSSSGGTFTGDPQFRKYPHTKCLDNWTSAIVSAIPDKWLSKSLKSWCYSSRDTKNKILCYWELGGFIAPCASSSHEGNGSKRLNCDWWRIIFDSLKYMNYEGMPNYQQVRRVPLMCLAVRKASIAD